MDTTTPLTNKEQQTATSSKKIRRFIDLFKPIHSDLGFEKQRKQAIYNLIAFSAFLFLILTVICCYFVLQQFLRPLVWALMFGFVLHPFKQKINSLILNWIDNLNETRRPAILEVFFLPFNLTNYCLTTLSTIVIQYGKLLGFIFIGLLFIHLTLYYFIFAYKIWLFINFFLIVIFNLFKYLHSFANIYVILTLAIGHFSVLCFLYNEDTKNILIKLTPVVWITLFYKILFMSNTIGTLLLILMILMLMIGVFAKFYGIKTVDFKGQTDSARNLNLNLNLVRNKIFNFILSLLPSHTEDELDLIEESVDSIDKSTENVKSLVDQSPVDASSPICKLNDDSSLSVNQSTKEDNLNKTSTFESCDKPIKKRLIRKNSIDKDSTFKQIKTNNLSDAYLYALVWSCFLAQIYIRPHLLYLLPIPISLYYIKWLWKIIKDTDLFTCYSIKIDQWIEERKEAIYNPIFCLIFEYLLISDHVLSRTLKKSVDSLSSLFVILFVIFGAIFATLFLAFQIYHESALLVELTANVMPTINSTIANDSEFGQILPKSLINNNIAQELLNKGYLHGREWLQTTIRTTFSNENLDSNATNAVEKQMLEVWDRIYHVWLFPHENCTNEEMHHPMYRTFDVYNWDKLFGALKKLDLKQCFNLMKENFDVIFSILESIWSVLKGNLKLMVSTLWVILSALLTGSTAILNVSLSLIVFITSLFYLLASSNNVYKPMEMLSKFMLVICGSEGLYVRKFEQAVEDSITSIFTATFKMSFFYGLYTWLILTLSESKIIYIPSVLAALLGAVPFIGVYWAFLPSILEYWLVYASGGKALLLLFFSIFPSYFVDTTIYSEIKGGGHPYLTALAICGGVYYFGSIEGALLGPLLLCCVCVIMKFQSDSENETNQ